MLRLDRDGIAEDYLEDNHADYLDCNNMNGEFSFITKNVAQKAQTTTIWQNTKRQIIKPGRIFAKIFNEKARSTFLKDTEIEFFSSQWKTKFANDLTIEVLRGWDIIEAYNFNGNLNRNIRSCANFRQKETNGGYAEPKIKWFYVYIFNPHAISAVILRKKNEIVARTTVFEGAQNVDSGALKKGNHYKFYNTIYTDGVGEHKKLLVEWMEGNGIRDFTCPDAFVVSLNTHFSAYPPIDRLYVSPNEDLFTNITHKTEVTKLNKNWVGAYKYTKGGDGHGGKERNEKEEESGLAYLENLNILMPEVRYIKI